MTSVEQRALEFVNANLDIDTTPESIAKKAYEWIWLETARSVKNQLVKMSARFGKSVSFYYDFDYEGERRTKHMPVKGGGHVRIPVSQVSFFQVYSSIESIIQRTIADYPDNQNVHIVMIVEKDGVGLAGYTGEKCESEGMEI